MVQTQWGPVKLKLARGYGVTHVKPEFEDAAELARKHGVPYQAVLQEALGQLRREDLQQVREPGSMKGKYLVSIFLAAALAAGALTGCGGLLRRRFRGGGPRPGNGHRGHCHGPQFRARRGL